MHYGSVQCSLCALFAMFNEGVRKFQFHESQFLLAALMWRTFKDFKNNDSPYLMYCP